MAAIGYERARNMMQQLGWKMTVKTVYTERGERVEEINLYHPKQRNVYLVRRDSGLRLMLECKACEQVDADTVVYCYGHSENKN